MGYNIQMSGQLILGKDIANDKYVPISVDSTGHLDIDVQVADLDSKCMASETGATDGTQRQARCDTGGRLLTAVLGNTEKDGSGTYEHLHTDGSGNLNTQIINTVSTNAFRTNIASGATNSHALVDADGHLQCDILTGGGGDATSANQATQIANQGTINTSIGTVNSTLGDTNSKIDAMRGSSDLGVVNTSIGTVNTSVGDTNSKIDAMRASDSLTTVKDGIVQNMTDGSAKTKIMGLFSGGQYQVATDASGHLQVDVLSGGGGGTQFAGEATLATTGTGTAMIGRDNTGTARLVAVDTAGNIQMDIVGNADTTKATSTLQTAGNASLTSVDGKITACNTGAVVVSSSALPTGASTEATALLAEAHLGNIDTATSSIQSNVSTSSNQGTMITSLSSLAGCVSGNELQVDIVSGGGSSSANSYLNATLSVLAPTGSETTKITATPSIDLLNISTITKITINTIDTNYTMIGKIAVEYSYDNSVFFTNLGSAGSPTFSSALDLAGIQRTDNGIPYGEPGAGNRVYNAEVFPDMDGARYARVVFLHSQNTSSGGANVSVVPIIVLNGK